MRTRGLINSLVCWGLNQSRHSEMRMHWPLPPLLSLLIFKVTLLVFNTKIFGSKYVCNFISCLQAKKLSSNYFLIKNPAKTSFLFARNQIHIYNYFFSSKNPSFIWTQSVFLPESFWYQLWKCLESRIHIK